MAEIKPVRGLRYTERAGGLANLLCPARREISAEEQARLAAENPYHAGQLQSCADAASVLESWLAEGILTQNKNDTIYIYETEFVKNREHYKNKGLLCLVKPEDGGQGISRACENQQAGETAACRAEGVQAAPVYALYEDPERETHARMERLSTGTPRYECTVGGVTHRLWAVNDKMAIRAFQEDFIPRRLLIVDEADSAEAIVCSREKAQYDLKESTDTDYALFFMVRIDADGVIPIAQHRMVRRVSDFHPESILKKCGECFDIYKMEEPRMIGYTLDALRRQWQKAFAFYAGGQDWYLLRLKGGKPPKDFLEGEPEAYRMLDTVLLRRLVLEPILGIAEERAESEKNLSFALQIDKTLEAVQSGEQQCAFFMNPARPMELLRVTEAGRKIPEKAAVFYPKPASGFVFCPIETRPE